jgi:hypothetical protein
MVKAFADNGEEHLLVLKILKSQIYNLKSKI